MPEPSSILEPPAEALPDNALHDHIYTYDQWSPLFSDPSVTYKEDLPNYLDYLRVTYLERGELDKQKEIDIQQFYAEEIIGDSEVSNEEYQKIASQSTGYRYDPDREANLVNIVYKGTQDDAYNAGDYAKKVELSNKARETLLATGDISYATLIKDDIGLVRSGNYHDQSSEGAGRLKSEKAAIEAYKSGYLDPRDMWQVNEGLNASGFSGRTKFQARQDDELTAVLGRLLGEEAQAADDGGATPLHDAIQSVTDRDQHLLGLTWWEEILADDPSDIDQVILDDLPEALGEVQERVIEKFIAEKKLSGVANEDQVRSLLSTGDKYSRDRIQALVKELATRHANLQGVFQYYEDPKDDKKNIRVTEMGSVLAHPTLMNQRDRFEKAVENDDRLSEEQKEIINGQRTLYMQGRVESLDELFSSYDAVEDHWEKAKSSNPIGFKNNPVGFIDDFLSKGTNYDSTENVMDGVKSSLGDAVMGIIHSVGAIVFKSKGSADYLVEHQKSEAGRKELAAIFGKPLGLGYDVATTVAPMVTDIGATALLTMTTGYGGASYASLKAGAGLTARATHKGIMKALTGSLLYKPAGMSAKRAAETLATKNLIENSGVALGGATAAIKSFNRLVQDRFVINSNLFLTSANRSAGGMYGTIYASLPDDMSHEEKHDKALGHSLLAGVVTGTIVSGMSALGMGGFENVLLRGLSYGSMKGVIDRIGGAKVGASVYQEALEKHITKRTGDIVKSILPVQLFRGAVHEGFEEGLDEFVNSFVRDAALDSKTPLRDKVMHAWHAAKIGAIMGSSVPVVRSGKALVSKVRGLAHIDPDFFRDQEVDRAVKALQTAGSPLSAAELRARFQQAARVEGRPEDEVDPEQPVPTTAPSPTTPTPTQPLAPITREQKDDYIKQMQEWLKEPTKRSPVIPPELLNSAVADGDLYLAKGGVILGIRDKAGNWIGKEPATPAPEAAPEAAPAPEVAPEAAPAPEVAPTPEPRTSTLPPELAGAKPRYSFGEKQFNLTFINDIDKASYIIAQKTRSKRDADYLDFVMAATGMTETEARDHGKRVKEYIKEQARGSDEGDLEVPSLYTPASPWTGVSSVLELPKLMPPRGTQDEYITVTPEELVTKEGAKKAIQQWLALGENRKRLKDNNIIFDRGSWRRAEKSGEVAAIILRSYEGSTAGASHLQGLDRDNGTNLWAEGQIKLIVNPLLVARHLTQATEANRVDAFHALMGHEMVHAVEALVHRDEFSALPEAEQNNYLAGWGDYVAEKEMSMFREMTPEQIRQTVAVYTNKEVADTASVSKTALKNNYGMTERQVVSEYVRMLVEYRAEGVTSESWLGSDVGKAIIEFVAKIVQRAKALLEGGQLDPITSEAIEKHVKQIEQRLADFWIDDLNKKLPNNAKESRAVFNDAIDATLAEEQELGVTGFEETVRATPAPAPEPETPNDAAYLQQLEAAEALGHIANDTELDTGISDPLYTTLANEILTPTQIAGIQNWLADPTRDADILSEAGISLSQQSLLADSDNMTDAVRVLLDDMGHDSSLVIHGSGGHAVHPSKRFKVSDVTPLIGDSTYLELAKDEDANREELQRMVIERASAAGSGSPIVYHGSANRGFTEFKLGKQKESGLDWSRSTGAAIHFSAKEEVADRYTGSSLPSEAGEVRSFILMGRYARLQTIGDKQGYDIKITLTDPDTGLVVWEETDAGLRKMMAGQGEGDGELNVEVITPRTIDILNELGFDGIYDQDSHEYAVLDPRNVKLADPVTRDADGNVIPLSQRFDEVREDIRYTPAVAPPVDDSAYLELAQDEEANREELQQMVDAYAKARGWNPDEVLYHGTTHDFNVFLREKGNLEGDYGAGFYLSSSFEDAVANYAGIGPDLSGRIERVAEGYDLFEYSEEEVVEFAEARGIDLQSIEGADLDEKLEEIATQAATKELAGGDERLITAYVRLKNPAVIGADSDGRHMRLEPYQMYDEEAMGGYRPEAERLVMEKYGVGQSDLTIYAPEIRQKQEEWADENGYYNQEPHPLLEAVENVGRDYTGLREGELGSLQEIIFEEPTLYEVDQILRGLFSYVSEESTGEPAAGEAVRRVYEEMGYDGIVDRQASAKFGEDSGRPQFMEGLYSGEYHVIAFDSSQIKEADPITRDEDGNVIPLSESFDETREDIRYAPAASETLPEVPIPINPKKLEENRNPTSDMPLEEVEERLRDLINHARFGSGTFGVELKIDESQTAERGAFWSQGEEMYVNPYGLHELVDGLRDQDAMAEIDSEIVRQAGSIASFRRIPQKELDSIVESTLEDDYNMIISSLPTDEQQISQTRLASEDPAVVKAEQERLVERRMNVFAARLLRGHTVEEDRVFFQSNPGWLATAIYYLEGMLNRVWAARESQKQNPYLTTGIHNLVSELRTMKGSYRIPSNRMAFDRNKPEATMVALRDTLEQEDAEAEVVSPTRATPAATAPAKKPPFRLSSVLDVLDVPIMEVGAYKEPPKWLNWLTGSTDPRLRRLNEMRLQYYRMLNKEMREYKEVFDQLINETYGSYKGAPAKLIADATGSTKGLLLDDAVREQIDLDHREAVSMINEAYAGQATERHRLIREANLLKEARIQYEQNVVKKREIEAARENALELIKKDSPDLAKHLRLLRGKVDEMSEQIATLTGRRNPKMKAHIDNQLGIYLTRSYKIFSDENWIDDVLTKDEHRELREEVKTQYIEQLKKDEAATIFDRYERQFEDDRKSAWNKLSFNGKMQQAMIEASEKVAMRGVSLHKQGKDLGDVLITEFLETYRKGFWDAPTSEVAGRTIDILKNKKNLPKFMLKLLGEYDGDTGDFNLMRSFMNVGTLAADTAMLNNMVEIGRKGSMDNWWFMTQAERKEVKKTNPELWEKVKTWQLVNKPKKGTRESGIRAYDPTRSFIDKGRVDRGPLYAPVELVEGIKETFSVADKKSEADRIASKLDAPLRKLTGLALGAKTLGSVPFYIRNIVSNVLFFGPAQGIMPLGKMFKYNPMQKGKDVRQGSIWEEIDRKLSRPEKVDAYSSRLVRLGVLDNEITSSTLKALKEGRMGDEDILGDMNKLLDDAAKAAGLTDIDTATKSGREKILKLIDEKGKKPLGKAWNATMDKLRNLSEVVDSFYKIAYFETELATMRKARDAASSSKDRLKDMKDSDLEEEAARKVKMTAQSYSQAPPVVAGMQDSSFGVMFAPYFRFKLEVPRIMINTYKLGIEEINSGNSVLAWRGTKRLSSMTAMVAGLSMLGKTLGEKLVVSVINAFGGEAEDDDLTEEQEDVIRLGAPSFLRSHTFYFFKLKGELHSLDLTYVNPFAMYADAVPRAWEHLKRGDEGEAIASFVDTLINVPFLDGQIAMTSFMQAKNNTDADGRPLWKNTDSAYDKMWKAGMHVISKAYAPPTLDRLSKLWASEQASREAFIETPYGLIATEFIPFKPYKIDPAQVKYRIMRDLGEDSDMIAGDIRRLMTGKLMTLDEVRDVAVGQVETQRRIGEMLKRVYTPLRELGVSAEDMESSINRFLTKEQIGVLSSENAMLVKVVPASVREVMDQADDKDVQERWLPFERTLLELAPNGRVYLSDD